MKNKIIILFLLFLLVAPASAQSSAQWCGIQTLFFQNAPSPDITGYEQLINYPSGAPEIDENITVQSTMGTVLLDTYISPPGSPDVDVLLKGLRRYRTFSYVNSASGTTRLNFTPFVRYANGTERNLYTVMSDDINDLTVNEYLTSYVSPVDLDLSPMTTRLGIRVSANTTHPSPIIVHWVYEGTYHYSSVESGFFVCNDTTGGVTNETYQYSPNSATPYPFWAIFAIAGVILFIMAFYKKLRDEKGGINKERVVLSLLGGIVNIFAAYLTLVVDIPNDGNHVLYEGGGMIVMLVIMGLLCFAGFVYAIVSPEIINSGKEDMGKAK